MSGSDAKYAQTDAAFHKNPPFLEHRETLELIAIGGFDRHVRRGDDGYFFMLLLVPIVWQGSEVRELDNISLKVK